MKNIGIVSYNIRCNFTNYGSALQSWALKESIEKLGEGKIHAKLVDYCSDAHKDSNPLNPYKNMWDKDEQTRKNCELTMPAIKENYKKFEDFYNSQFDRTKRMYTSKDFDSILEEEQIDAFVCGADTIFCVDEFGIDDVFYANKNCMKENYTFSYAASFGDSHFNTETYKLLDERINNFKAIGIRENGMLEYIKQRTNVEVERVIDPTLLLNAKDYESITKDDIPKEKYILLYARRGNQIMEDYADELAKKLNCKVIEISLKATNEYKHEMRYDAGVEEFLNLVKNAEYVVTNSYHGMIFSVQFSKPFVVFSREQCDTKIEEVLDIIGLRDRLLVTGNEKFNENIDYNLVHKNIEKEREKAIRFLQKQLTNIEGE